MSKITMFLNADIWLGECYTSFSSIFSFLANTDSLLFKSTFSLVMDFGDSSLCSTMSECDTVYQETNQDYWMPALYGCINLLCWWKEKNNQIILSYFLFFVRKGVKEKGEKDEVKKSKERERKREILSGIYFL